MSDVTQFVMIIIGIGGLLWFVQTGWQRSVRWVNHQGAAIGLSYRRQQVWGTITKIFGPIGSLLFFLFNPGTGLSPRQFPQWNASPATPGHYEAPTELPDQTATVPPDSDFCLVVVKNRNGKGAKIGKQFALIDGIHSVGRKPTAEPGVVCITIENDRAVSRNHLYIEAESDGVFSVTDRGSAHGTRLNGHRLEADQHSPFKIGDILQIGNTHFELAQGSGTRTSVGKIRKEQFRLRVIIGSDKGKIFNITNKKVIIGRSKDADWQLDDPKVSRRHAELKQEGKQFVLKDLNSSHGMFVNDLLIESRTLAAGDTVKLGDTKIIFEAA